MVQLQNSALLLRRGRIIARISGKKVFVDDFCNSGFPQFFCVVHEKNTEYMLLTMDHTVLVQSFLHSHSSKHVTPSHSPGEIGRQLFFQGLQSKKQALEKEILRLHLQEKVLLSMMGKRDSVQWMSLFKGKTGIPEIKNCSKIGSIFVDSIESEWLGDSMKVEVVGRSKVSSADLVFWCFTLNQGCSVQTKRTLIQDERFRCTLLIRGVSVVMKMLSFCLFAISDSFNLFVGEYNLVPSTRSQMSFSLVFDEYRESSRILHLLKQIPDVCFSYATSVLKSVKIPKDFGAVLRIEQIIKSMDPETTVLLDRLCLSYTKDLIDVVREALLSELAHLKEESNVVLRI